MSFFQKIYELADGADLAINIKRKNEKLTVSVLPSNARNVTPVIITGTPEDLESGFLDTVTQQLEKSGELQLQIVASMATEEPKPKKEAKPTKEAKLKDKDKPAKKAEVPKKEEPKLEHPSLF